MIPKTSRCSGTAVAMMTSFGYCISLLSFREALTYIFLLIRWRDIAIIRSFCKPLEKFWVGDLRDRPMGDSRRCCFPTYMLDADL